MPVKKIERNELLKTCWEVFHRHGYNATSISMLADATGLGKSGLLHHYGSKEALMRAVMEYSREQFDAYVLSVAQEDLPVEQRLEKLLRRQNRLAKIDRRGCFYANTAIETGRDEIFKTIIETYFEEWLDAVAALLEYGWPANARGRAYQLLLEYQGAVTFYKCTGDEAHLEAFVVRHVQRFKQQLNQTIPQV
jgi:AcrR family transcriptional regulator